MPQSSPLLTSECPTWHGVYLLNLGQFMLPITEFTLIISIFTSGDQLTN
jgi:hypothetical protein